MTAGVQLAASEEVVRAAMYPFWDPDLQRASPSAFTSEEVSVSRLAILDITQIVALFQRDFASRLHPDGESRAVRATGRATVKTIVEQANLPRDDKSIPDVVLSVVEDPLEDNAAHALICGLDRANPSKARRIPRGVAKRLVDAFNWEPLPAPPG